LVSSFNYVIISGSNQESQILEDEKFTKSSYSTMMEEFEYCGLFKQLNKEKKIDDVSHTKVLP